MTTQENYESNAVHFATRRELGGYFWDNPCLETLIMSGDMEELPHLPSTLAQLWITSAPNLIKLSDLPPTLRWLIVRNCPKLSMLPAIPEHTRQVVVEHCANRTLPELPDTVTDLRLQCEGDFEFPQLPANLDLMIINGFGGHVLPPLPASLRFLVLTDCPNLFALPESLTRSASVHIRNCARLKGASSSAAGR